MLRFGKFQTAMFIQQIYRFQAQGLLRLFSLKVDDLLATVFQAQQRSRQDSSLQPKTVA